MENRSTFSAPGAVLEISVVICAYTDKRWGDLVAAIESVKHQTVLPKEIIVVIDHNHELLERAKTSISGIVALENEQQQGLSGARNTGIATAQGDVIAFLDDDAVAEPDWLEHLRNGYKDNVLGVGGPIQPMWLEGRPRWFPEEFDWVVGCTFRGLPETTSVVGKLIGCNMSFRREVFHVLGGFRSDMGRVGTHPLAGEETEFSIRVCQRWPDKVLLYEPKARVHHRVPTMRANFSYFRTRCYCEGLSKAAVSRLVGTQDGLASERTYTFQTLPLGMLRGVGNIVSKRDPMGVARAGMIAAGLFITIAGYAQSITTEKLSTLKKARFRGPLTGEDPVL